MNHETASYLCHHGVKGMKWGVRKQETRGGLPSARKIKKQIKDLEKHEDKRVNSKLVDKKINSEVKKSKEYRDFDTFTKNINSLHEALVEQTGNKNAKLLLPSDVVKDYDESYKAYQKKHSEIRSKYIDEYAGALLKDLGYEDTQKGREYLRKLR